MRKSQVAKNEAEKALARLKEIEELRALAEAEENAKVDAVKENIDAMCKEHGLYCGVILNAEQISQIVKLAIETKESVKIGYQIYFEE